MDEDFTVEVRNLLRRCVLSILHQLEQRSGESSSLENAQFRLEWLLGIVIRYHHSNIIQQAVVDLLSEALSIIQPRTQALSTTRLAGGKTLVQAGHVSPRFWEITIGTYGVGKANVAFEFKKYKECE